MMATQKVYFAMKHSGKRVFVWGRGIVQEEAVARG